MKQIIENYKKTLKGAPPIVWVAVVLGAGGAIAYFGILIWTLL